MPRLSATLSLITLLLALAPSSSAPPADGLVRSLDLDPTEFDDLADLLRVVKRSGRVKLAIDAPKGHLEVELYRAGKVDPKAPAVGYDVTVVPGSYRGVRFAVQIADLDHLPLGSGPERHVRLLLKVAPVEGGLVASNAFDVPKDVFDHGQGIGGSTFPANAGTEAKVPLFWLAAGSNHTKSGGTPKEVVANNPNAQVAIFYLRLGDRK